MPERQGRNICEVPCRQNLPSNEKDGWVGGWTSGGCGCGCGCVYTRGKAGLRRTVPPRNVIPQTKRKRERGRERKGRGGFVGLYGMMDKLVLGGDDRWFIAIGPDGGLGAKIRW